MKICQVPVGCWWGAGEVPEDIRKVIDIGEASVTHWKKMSCRNYIVEDRFSYVSKNAYPALFITFIYAFKSHR